MPDLYDCALSIDSMCFHEKIGLPVDADGYLILFYCESKWIQNTKDFRKAKLFESWT